MIAALVRNPGGSAVDRCVRGSLGHIHRGREVLVVASRMRSIGAMRGGMGMRADDVRENKRNHGHG